MTTSTCRTVSTEEVNRFAAQMAQELGLTDVLAMEPWANPSSRNLSVPNQLTHFRNHQLRLQAFTKKASPFQKQ